MLKSCHTTLYKSISKGDQPQVEKSLNDGAKVNDLLIMSKSKTVTPLTLAVRHDHFEIMKTLISRGANVNATERNGTSPLTLAVKKGRTEMAKFLLEKGANTCKPDRSGKTPLSWAVSKKNLKMVELLLDYGAQFTMHTCLLQSISLKYFEIALFLIRKGALVNFEDENGYTPLIKCAEICTRDDQEIIDKLIENGADVNKANRSWETPLIHAIRCGNVEVATYLINNGASVNSAGPNGTLPLIKAMELGNVQLVKEITSNGVNVNQTDLSGNYPITKAVEMGNCEILEYLVENGAKIDVSDPDGYTPFMKSIYKQNYEMVKFLLLRVRDVDQEGPNEETGLMVALAKSDFRTFDLLIEAGADPKPTEALIKKMAERNRNFAAYVKSKPKLQQLID